MRSVNDVGEEILAQIARRYSSDAAFERAAVLPPKTVNNWRRGRSASYMKMLPQLAALFGTEPAVLLEGEKPEDTQKLNRDEVALLTAFRQARGLGEKERSTLLETLKSIIRLSCGGVGQ